MRDWALVIRFIKKVCVVILLRPELCGLRSSYGSIDFDWKNQGVRPPLVSLGELWKTRLKAHAESAPHVAGRGKDVYQ